MGRGSSRLPPWGFLCSSSLRPQRWGSGMEASRDLFCTSSSRALSVVLTRGSLQELFWDVGFPEARPQAGVPNRTFPKIAGQGGGWWRLRPGLGSSCTLWLTKCSGVSLPAKPRVTEVTSVCPLPRGRQTTTLCNFGGCAVRAHPKAKTP